MGIHVKVTESFGVPDSCLTDYDLPYTDCHAFDITTTGKLHNSLRTDGNVFAPAVKQWTRAFCIQ